MKLVRRERDRLGKDFCESPAGGGGDNDLVAVGVLEVRRRRRMASAGRPSGRQQPLGRDPARRSFHPQGDQISNLVVVPDPSAFSASTPSASCRSMICFTVLCVFPRIAAAPRQLPKARRLRRSPAGPRRAKVALLAAVIWVVSPIDLLPEFLPVIWPLDDDVAVVLLLRYAARSIPRDRLVAAWPAELRLLDRLLDGRRRTDRDPKPR